MCAARYARYSISGGAGGPVDVGDLLQTISLSAVAITIGLSVVQNRHVAAQTREAVQQSRLAQSDLKQAAHLNTVANSSLYLAQLASSDPGMLEWFLASRGIPPATAEINKRYMLMYLRMEVHETTYIAYLDGALHKDVWGGWERVIELDLATAEFRAVWAVVRDSYAQRFGDYVEALIKASRPGPAGSGGTGIRSTGPAPTA
jgi:hypothetical protein